MLPSVLIRERMPLHPTSVQVLLMTRSNYIVEHRNCENLSSYLTSFIEGLKLCVEWGTINTGWHIDVRYVKLFCTHMKCEVKTEWDMEIKKKNRNKSKNGSNGWGIYGKVSYCFREICSKYTGP